MNRGKRVLRNKAHPKLGLTVAAPDHVSAHRGTLFELSREKRAVLMKQARDKL